MKQWFVFFMVVALFSGCKKYLDIKPKGYLIPQTVEDFENLLNNFEMVKPISSTLEVFTDDYYLPKFDKNKYTINPVNQAYLWAPNVFNSQVEYKYDSFYNQLYNNIYHYNAVINEVDKAPGGTAERKAIVKARARLGRALSYWYLINLYAKPYNAATAATDPGVNLPTSTDINAKLAARNNVQDCFAFILNDLNEAIPFLPLSASNGFQFTKGAGYGVLARTYLMMARYVESGAAARAALKTNDKLVDYNSEYTTFSWAGYNFLSWKETGPLQNLLMPENLLVLNYTINSDFAVPPLTEQLFAADDIRRASFFPFITYSNNIPAWDGKTYLFSTYLGNKPNMGIGTPEMYLVSAEAYARTGNIGAAMADVNWLRKHRIKSAAYTDLTAGNEKDALGIILTERRRELLCKGVRWFDMRRLNSDPDFGFTAKHYFKDGTFIELAPGSPRYVLRLPDAAITSDVLQNP
jgi:hypothetical protein